MEDGRGGGSGGGGGGGCVADSDVFSGIIWSLSIRSKMLVRHPAEWSCFLSLS